MLQIPPEIQEFIDKKITIVDKPNTINKNY